MDNGEDSLQESALPQKNKPDFWDNFSERTSDNYVHCKQCTKPIKVCGSTTSTLKRYLAVHEKETSNVQGKK